ncbi:hypothetical protein AB3G45_22425 [Shinella sp. S4-D37]|uniref:hypothetical protein n=1 Tax=Shinella sp. S4-D37 TaxID=3161999 RepID=UPI0034669AD0
MKVKTENTAQGRGGRSFARKMTVEMPAETLTALKVYAARRQTTVREIVIEAVGNHLKCEGEQA